MRFVGIVLLACALPGCGEQPAEQPAPPADDRGRIACVPPGESEFREICTVDRLVDEKGVVLTLRLPDGGFHRLRVDPNGDAIVAADGMRPARVSSIGPQGIEVMIGDARFRLPAGGS